MPITQYTLEELAEADRLAQLLLGEEHVIPLHAIKRVLGDKFDGSLESAFALKPDNLRLVLVDLPHDEGFLVGASDHLANPAALQYVFASPVQAVLFVLLSYHYRDALHLLSTGAAGNA